MFEPMILLPKTFHEGEAIRCMAKYCTIPQIPKLSDNPRKASEKSSPNVFQRGTFDFAGATLA